MRMKQSLTCSATIIITLYLGILVYYMAAKDIASDKYFLGIAQNGEDLDDPSKWVFNQDLKVTYSQKPKPKKGFFKSIYDSLFEKKQMPQFMMNLISTTNLKARKPYLFL